MDVSRFNVRRTRHIRIMASWMSNSTYFQRHATQVTVVKAHPRAQSNSTEIGGLRQLSNENNSFGLRIAWLIIIIGATILCFLQSAETLSYYISDPTRVHVQYIQNDTLKMPAVSFCRLATESIPKGNHYLKLAKYGYEVHDKTLFDWLRMGNVSIFELWSLFKPNIWTIPLIKYDNLEDAAILQQLINVTEVYSPLGTCFQVTFNSQLKRLNSQPLFVLKPKRQNSQYCTAILSVPEETPFDIYFYHTKAITIHGVLTSKIGIQVTESIFRNTLNNPCGDTKSVTNCLLQCFENVFIRNNNKSQCRLPFMRHFNETAECSSKQELVDMLHATYEAAKQFNPKKCKCHRMCRQLFYTFNDIQEINNRYYTFEVYVPDGKITVLKEEAAYSIYDAVSDLGGCLALWLGVCFLQLLEVGKSCTLRLLFRKNSKKSVPKVSCVNGRRFQIVVIREAERKTETLPTLNLPGFHNATNYTSPFWARAAWLTTSIVALLLCLSQCAQRLAMYFSDPSTVNVYYTNDLSLPFPMIMVCPTRTEDLVRTLSVALIQEKLGKSYNYTDVLQFVNTGKLTIDELWNMSGFSTKYTTNITLANKDWISTIVPTAFGNCLTFQPKRYINFKRTPVGEVLHVYKDVEPGNMFITIFPKEILPLVKHLLEVEFYVNGKGKFMHSSYTAFRIKQVSYRNFQDNPCLQHEQMVRCLVECFEKKVSLKIPQSYCRFPFMSANAPPCTTIMDMDAVLNGINSIRATFNREDCMCFRSCSETIYFKDYFRILTESRHYSIVQMHVWNKEIMVMEEIRAYSSFVLFSDFGAAIGLFSGICLMNLFEIAEFLFYKIFRFFGGRYSLKKVKKQIEPQVFHRRIIILEGYADGAGNDHKVTDKSSYVNSEENNPCLWTRILWFLISSGLFCCCCFMMLERIQHYISDPTLSTIYYSINRTITFPRMLFCPYIDHSLYSEQNDGVGLLDYWNTSKFQPRFMTVTINKVENVKVNGILKHVAEFLDFFSEKLFLLTCASAFTDEMMDIPFIYYITVRSVTPVFVFVLNLFALSRKQKTGFLKWNGSSIMRDEFIFSLATTAAGICIMITLKKPVEFIGANTHVDVQIHLKSKASGWVAIFPDEKLPLIRYLNPKDVLTTNGIRMFQTLLSVRITEVVHRSTRQLPCADTRTVASCLADCIERKIYEKLGKKCRLPFMQESSKQHRCERNEEYLAVKRATVDILENFSQTDCNCPKERRVTIYSVANLVYQAEALILLKFQTSILGNTIPVTQEEAAYSFSKLLMDLGGYLGLFFGLGLPQLIEMLAEYASQLKNLICHRTK